MQRGKNLVPIRTIVQHTHTDFPGPVDTVLRLSVSRLLGFNASALQAISLAELLKALLHGRDDDDALWRLASEKLGSRLIMRSYNIVHSISGQQCCIFCL